MKLEEFCDDHNMHIANNLDFESLTFFRMGKNCHLCLKYAYQHRKRKLKTSRGEFSEECLEGLQCMPGLC